MHFLVDVSFVQEIVEGAADPAHGLLGHSARPQLPLLNRWREASATRFDCCLSQEILDVGNGLLTT